METTTANVVALVVRSTTWKIMHEVIQVNIVKLHAAQGECSPFHTELIEIVKESKKNNEHSWKLTEKNRCCWRERCKILLESWRTS